MEISRATTRASVTKMPSWTAHVGHIKLPRTLHSAKLLALVAQETAETALLALSSFFSAPFVAPKSYSLFWVRPDS